MRSVCSLYYQYDVDRLPACPLTVHALLHTVDDIEMNGPHPCNWSFLIERYCGSLLPAIKSRKLPFVALSMRVLQTSQLNDIKNRYGLHKILQGRRASGDEPSSHERGFSNESGCAS